MNKLTRKQAFKPRKSRHDEFVPVVVDASGDKRWDCGHFPTEAKAKAAGRAFAAESKCKLWYVIRRHHDWRGWYVSDVQSSGRKAKPGKWTLLASYNAGSTYRVHGRYRKLSELQVEAGKLDDAWLRWQAQDPTGEDYFDLRCKIHAGIISDMQLPGYSGSIESSPESAFLPTPPCQAVYLSFLDLPKEHLPRFDGAAALSDLLFRQATAASGLGPYDRGAVVLRNWTEGGTGLTNFSRSQEPLYLAAIKEYGDPAFVIAHAPCFAGGNEIAEDYSLHRLGALETCSPFWDVFERLRDTVFEPKEVSRG